MTAFQKIVFGVVAVLAFAAMISAEAQAQYGRGWHARADQNGAAHADPRQANR